MQCLLLKDRQQQLEISLKEAKSQAESSRRALQENSGRFEDLESQLAAAQTAALTAAKDHEEAITKLKSELEEAQRAALQAPQASEGSPSSVSRPPSAEGTNLPFLKSDIVDSRYE